MYQLYARYEHMVAPLTKGHIRKEKLKELKKEREIRVGYLGIECFVLKDDEMERIMHSYFALAWTSYEMLLEYAIQQDMLYGETR